MKIRFFACALFLAIPLYAQSNPAPAMDHASCPMDHATSLETRGDMAMGFSHDKGLHHFVLYPDGGAIQLHAINSGDITTKEEIRTHLQHIAGMFSAGDFDVPMFIHDRVPPGVKVMKARRAKISYRYEELPQGAAIRIVSTDARAIEAVHAFLRFQIEDHKTGDVETVQQ